MKITADTNVLVRLIVRDDAAQMAIAAETLDTAEIVAIPTPVLCEFSWVLRDRYKLPAADIARSIRGFLESANVRMDRETTGAGLAMLDAGGDFADGVIAHEGARLGGETFVSFDKKALKLLAKAGKSAQLLR